MRLATRLTLVAAGVTVSLGACSASDDAPATPPSGPSWDCIEAVQGTGLTTGTPVADAREKLTRLADDADLPEGKRAFYEDLHEALADLPDAATVGTALDDVPCPVE